MGLTYKIELWFEYEVNLTNLPKNRFLQFDINLLPMSWIGRRLDPNGLQSKSYNSILDLARIKNDNLYLSHIGNFCYIRYEML